MIQSFTAAVDGHPLHDEIVSVLDGFATTDINALLSSQLVDTMNSFDMVESPVEANYVTSEINEFLHGETTSEQRERAFGLVTAQFEDVIGEAYFAAMEALVMCGLRTWMTFCAQDIDDTRSVVRGA